MCKTKPKYFRNHSFLTGPVCCRLLLLLALTDTVHLVSDMGFTHPNNTILRPSNLIYPTLTRCAC